MYTVWLSSQQMKDSSYFPRLPFCLKLMLICIVWGLLGYCGHNKQCDFPTGFFSSVWNGSHGGIWNNHCSDYALFLSSLSSLFLSSTTNYLTGIEQAALWATCLLFIVTPLHLWSALSPLEEFPRPQSQSMSFSGERMHQENNIVHTVALILWLNSVWVKRSLLPKIICMQ